MRVRLLLLVAVALSLTACPPRNTATAGSVVAYETARSAERVP